MSTMIINNHFGTGWLQSLSSVHLIPFWGDLPVKPCLQEDIVKASSILIAVPPDKHARKNRSLYGSGVLGQP